MSKLSIAQRLGDYVNYLNAEPPLQCHGRLVRMVGLTLEAVGCHIPVGGRCLIESSHARVEAEVVGFDKDKLFLMPIASAEGLKPGALVTPIRGQARVPVGEELLGRVINGEGEVLDALGPLVSTTSAKISGKIINPLNRAPIEEPLDVGIKAINGLLTIGRGQRMGLFAGSGVGKSVLLGMMTKFTTAEVIVVGLIGERGREVKEFIEQILGTEGLARAIVVASPADDPPLLRIHGAMQATAIAEYFRDQGKNVLLLMDSLTRFAQAQREIALAVGEPPATKGYPPSVFAKIPQLVERAGNGKLGGGSITAFYTVLTEGDDVQDPIADSARAILDGHIVLSRKIAEQGIYPAIDVEASISRAMPNIVSKEKLEMSQLFRQVKSEYESNKDLLSVGAYQRGSNPMMDVAIERYPHFMNYIKQSMKEPVPYQDCDRQLIEMLMPVVQWKKQHQQLQTQNPQGQ